VTSHPLTGDRVEEKLARLAIVRLEIEQPGERAGDPVVGDGDAVVIAPSTQVDAILATGRTREHDEARIMARLESGLSTLEVY
jgi:regulator of RNase E activity RraA